jgi:hypothetical protein
MRDKNCQGEDVVGGSYQNIAFVFFCNPLYALQAEPV